MKYKYRNRETYKGKKLDIKANTVADLTRKTEAKKREIDKYYMGEDLRLSDFLDMYLTAKTSTIEPNTMRNYDRYRRYLYDYIGDKKVSRISPLELQSFLATHSDMAQGSIDNLTMFTRAVFRYAYKLGLTERNLADLIETPKGRPPRKIDSLTVAEQERLLTLIDGHKYQLFFGIMLHCGLRPGEVLALQWNDIKDGEISVTKSMTQKGEIKEPKTKSGIRTVPIPDCFPLTGRPSFDRVVPTSHNNIHVEWRKLQKQVPTAYPLYCLRHTYCTNLERKGVPLNIARQLMGHANIQTTYKIYTHRNEESIETAKNLINAQNEVGNKVGNIG